jgi:tetratricopeptide (TPR) repeat protein
MLRTPALPPRSIKAIGLGALVCVTASAQAQLVADKLLVAGDSLMGIDKPQRALAEYDKALKLEPSPRTYLARAKAWYAMDRMDRFLLDVEQLLRMDSTHVEGHYLRAMYAYSAGDMPRAEHHADRSIRCGATDPLVAKVLVLRGEARAELKRYPEALADLEAGMAKGVEDVDAMRTLARLYDALGRHADALAVLERLCELEPRDVGHWSNRGYELIHLERYDEALSILEKALTIDRDEPTALSNRAFVLWKKGRLKEAWNDVERSLRYYPANPFALRTRAVLRLDRGDINKACEDLNLSKALGGAPLVDALLKEHCSN